MKKIFYDYEFLKDDPEFLLWLKSKTNIPGSDNMNSNLGIKIPRLPNDFVMMLVLAWFSLINFLVESFTFLKRFPFVKSHYKNRPTLATAHVLDAFKMDYTPVFTVVFVDTEGYIIDACNVEEKDLFKFRCPVVYEKIDRF